jgi:hypothetical protein
LVIKLHKLSIGDLIAQMPPQTTPEKEPIVSASLDLLLCGTVGTLATTIGGIISEPLIQYESATQRHALEANIRANRTAITTEKDELDLLKHKGSETSDFATFLHNQIGVQEQQVATLQVEVKPYEKAQSEFILTAMAIGFFGAVALRGAYIAWTDWRARRNINPSQATN